MGTPTPATLEALLTAARKRIQVTDEEIEEAKGRRAAIAQALRKEFPGSRVYYNGSLAHGDALTPLADVDLGVVIAEAKHTHGPGKAGPSALQQRAADAIRRELKPTYGDLRVEVRGRKRSILIRFNDPVSARFADFTADVIIAIEHPSGVGLFIPRYAGWDRSHPEEHTALVRQAIEDTRVSFAHIVRLLKHWNRSNGKPLCTWNIKALALGCLLTPTTQLDGVVTWFEYAARQLAQGETRDPAGVADKPISLPLPRGEVVDRLRAASKRVREAIALQDAGYPVLAHDEIAKLFNDEDMLPPPSRDAVRREEACRLRDNGSTVTLVNPRPYVPVKSWAP